jgi:twitching motility protein PilT
MTTPTLQEILKVAVEKDTSDILIKAECHPTFLIRGKTVLETSFPVLSGEDCRKILFAIMNPEQIAAFERDLDFDMSFEIPNLSRFRVNLFHEKGHPGSVMRAIKSDGIRSTEQLGLPPVLRKLVVEKQGLILVTGPTGSGKTTTLAAMLDYANAWKDGHIVTIEDPIEVMYANRRSVITQREVGNDTKSFSQALRAALRQAPTIILIGEMRDRETIESALKAAETGHLVLSTLHTNDSVQTINRILNAFPPQEQDPIRIQLSNVLKACVAQRLAPRADKPERRLVLDILINTTTAKEAMLKNQIDELYEVVKTGTFDGMQSTQQALLEGYRQGYFSAETCIAYSNLPNEMMQLLRAAARGG